MRDNLLKKYDVAIIDAQRFMSKAIKAREIIKKDTDYYSGKHTASAKRASMDLTRSLAELRKSN